MEELNLSRETAYGACERVCRAMKDKFNELELIRGHYYCTNWGRREHWWLKAPDGEMLDPTAIQFPSKGFGDYEELAKDTPEPTGKCPNCGEYCYNNEQVHSECYDAFVRSLHESPFQ